MRRGSGDGGGAGARTAGDERGRETATSLEREREILFSQRETPSWDSQAVMTTAAAAASDGGAVGE